MASWSQVVAKGPGCSLRDAQCLTVAALGLLPVVGLLGHDAQLVPGDPLHFRLAQGAEGEKRLLVAGAGLGGVALFKRQVAQLALDDGLAPAVARRLGDFQAILIRLPRLGEAPHDAQAVAQIGLGTASLAPGVFIRRCQRLVTGERLSGTCQ